MVARIQVACEESRPYTGHHCGYIDVEVPDTLIANVADAVTDAGWTHDQKGYHCPRHNPADRWLRLRLSTEQDTEPVPGIRIRLRRSDETAGAFTAEAELFFDPQRYDAEEFGDGILERAKHVSEQWPT